MGKVVYPEEGITAVVLGYHRTAYDYLTYAYNQTGFDLPTSLGYAYRNYLYSLDDKIRVYKREMNSILDNIQKVNNKMEDLATELYREVNTDFPVKNVSEREGLIK